MNATVAGLFADHAVIAVSDHPRLRTTLWRLTRDGELASPLPGVLIRAHDHTPFTRLAALCLWSRPRGVIHGSTAAEVWTQRELSSPLRIAHPTLRSRDGVLVSRHLVPPEFVIVERGIRLAAPAYLAAELATTDEGRLLSEFLRTGLALQSAVGQALAAFSRCPGQVGRRRAVCSCEANPWSFAEVRLHRILREGGITGWRGNATIRIAGHVYHPDVLFEDEWLVIEFDGRGAHTSASQFVADRERQNALVLAGYRVLRFTWEHLDDPEYVLSCVRKSRNELRWERSAIR